MREATERKSTEDLINSCMDLVYCLKEAHQEELIHDHYGETGCLCCKALAEADAAIRQGLKWHCLEK